MTRFTITSGPFRVIMLAGDAFEAAVEAVRYWGYDTSSETQRGRPAALPAEIRVACPGEGTRVERFATRQLLAYINRQSLDAAWENLLLEIVSNN